VTAPRTTSVVGYVIVEASYLDTLKLQNDKGGAACANAPAVSSVKPGGQVVVKDASGTSVDVLALETGYAQFPMGHTDASPANELACVYAFRGSKVKVPTDMVSFELTGYPSIAVKVSDAITTLRPQIKVGNVRGDWSDYRMKGD